MILIGDIGNTDTKICVINNKHEIIKRIIIPTNRVNNSILSNKLNFYIKRKNLIRKSLFCSVVPNKFITVKKFVKKNLKIKCTELKQLNLNKIIKIKVNRKQVGSDRLANSISVMSLKNNYIILDFGTATTFDVIVKNNYIGGLIAPGLNISLKTLISKAKLIPKIHLKKTKQIIGKNTSNAVRAGFFWGYIGLVNNILNLIKKETRKNFKVIITGGFSNLFYKKLNTKAIISKDVTINGLIKIIKLYKF